MNDWQQGGFGLGGLKVSLGGGCGPLPSRGGGGGGGGGRGGGGGGGGGGGQLNSADPVIQSEGDTTP